MSAPLRFGYVDTAHGQMHYRAAGLGEPLTRSVLLLHWTPGSGAQYDAFLHELARRGFRAFAPDLAGYGASPGGARDWLIADFAKNVLEIAQVLTPVPFALLGGHVAAEVAAQAALLAPERISHLILDGSPTWDREFRHKLLADIRPTAPKPVADGSHLVQWWQHILWEMKLWQPDFKLDDIADTDPLRDQHEKVLSLLPAAQSHVFAGAHPIHDPRRAAEYAGVLVDFIETAGHRS